MQSVAEVDESVIGVDGRVVGEMVGSDGEFIRAAVESTVIPVDYCLRQPLGQAQLLL
jgi:hypothetical protein